MEKIGLFARLNSNSYAFHKNDRQVAFNGYAKVIHPDEFVFEQEKTRGNGSEKPSFLDIKMKKGYKRAASLAAAIVALPYVCAYFPEQIPEPPKNAIEIPVIEYNTKVTGIELSTINVNRLDRINRKALEVKKAINLMKTLDEKEKIELLKKEVSKNPIGKRLVELAEKKGIKIKFYKKEGLDGYNNQYTKTIVLNPHDDKAANLAFLSNVEILAHELVHSLTPEKGNSQMEEFFAAYIGDQVKCTVTGEENKGIDAIAEIVSTIYSDLPLDNGIANSLVKLGFRIHPKLNRVQIPDSRGVMDLFPCVWNKMSNFYVQPLVSVIADEVN